MTNSIRHASDKYPRLKDPVTDKGFSLRVAYKRETTNPGQRKKAHDLKIIPTMIASKKLINMNGESIQNGFYKYVIKDQDNILLLGEELKSSNGIHLSLTEARSQNKWRQTAQYKHSYIATFEPVKYAGYIKIMDGKIDDIDLHSGHYAVPQDLGYLLIDKFQHLFSNTFSEQLENREPHLFLTSFYKNNFDRSEIDDQTDPYCETIELHALDKKLEYMEYLASLYERMGDIFDTENHYKKSLNKYYKPLNTSRSIRSRSDTPNPPQALLDLKRKVDEMRQEDKKIKQYLSHPHQLDYFREEFGNDDINLEVISNKISALKNEREILYNAHKDEFLLDSE